MKYDHAYEMFYDMMNFALRNGMTSYQSDLMHDAVELAHIGDNGEPADLIWVVKSDGCGTWLWNCGNIEMPDAIRDSGINVEITYNGKHWTAERIY